MPDCLLEKRKKLPSIVLSLMNKQSGKTTRKKEI